MNTDKGRKTVAEKMSEASDQDVGRQTEGKHARGDKDIKRHSEQDMKKEVAEGMSESADEGSAPR